METSVRDPRAGRFLTAGEERLGRRASPHGALALYCEPSFVVALVNVDPQHSGTGVVVASSKSCKVTVPANNALRPSRQVGAGWRAEFTEKALSDTIRTVGLGTAGLESPLKIPFLGCIAECK